MSSTIEEQIKSYVAPVLDAASAFISNKEIGDSIKWRFCLYGPINIAVSLTCKVIELRPAGMGERTDDRLISSFIARYLIELAVNLGVILNAESPALRITRLEQWVAMQNMIVHGGGTYGIQIDTLGKKAKERLERKGGNFHKMQGATEGQTKEYIKTEDKAFSFNDVWGLTTAEKVKYLNLGNDDENSFIDRWKMYSHISHASAFSIYPRWMTPIPRFDSVQCLSIIVGCIANFLEIRFDAEEFCKEIYKKMASTN